MTTAAHHTRTVIATSIALGAVTLPLLQMATGLTKTQLRAFLTRMILEGVLSSRAGTYQLAGQTQAEDPCAPLSEEEWALLLRQADEIGWGPHTEQEEYLQWRDREHTCPDCGFYIGDHRADGSCPTYDDECRAAAWGV